MRLVVNGGSWKPCGNEVFILTITQKMGSSRVGLRRYTQDVRQGGSDPKVGTSDLEASQMI